MDKNMQIVDMADIRHKAAGETHFFDPESMRFFDSRISQTGYQTGRMVFFVTSERFRGLYSPDGPRLYTVRALDLDTWRISTHPDHDHFQAYQNGRAAHRAARAAAAQGEG